MTAIMPTTGLVKIKLPSREEIRAMWQHPSIVITAIVCATAVALGALWAVVYLADHGRDAMVVGALVGTALTAVGTLINARVRRLGDKIDQQSSQPSREG